MDWLFFVLQHTPFWAVPLGMISAQFTYVYWVREFKRTALCFSSIGFLCLIFIVFYYWAGGPEKVAGKLREILSVIF